MYITTADDKELELEVNLINPMDGGFEPGHVTTGRIRIELTAPDMNMYGQSTSEQTMTPPIAGGVALPTVLPFAFASSGGNYIINNDGNGIVYPTVKIYGPATNVNVRNLTTGEYFSIAIKIESGDYVTVDLEEQTVLLNGVTNYLHYFSGEFIYLKAGNNIISFSSDENDPNSYAVISWNNAYIGI